MLGRSLLTAALALLTSAAAAQYRQPVTVAPLPIAPPGDAQGSAQHDWTRAEQAREQRHDQRERDRLDAEPRKRPSQQVEDSRDRGLLGAPVFVQPGAPVVVQPGAPPYYAAPQYPFAGGSGYGGAPAYPPGYAPAAPRLCQQYAPAYDEAGRFLAQVCVR